MFVFKIPRNLLASVIFFFLWLLRNMSISLWSTISGCNDILYDWTLLLSAFRVPETLIVWIAIGFSLISVMEAMEARTISRALWEQRTIA